MTPNDLCTLPDRHDDACNGHPRPACCAPMPAPQSSKFESLSKDFLKDDQQRNGAMPINMQLSIRQFARWLDARFPVETPVALAPSAAELIRQIYIELAELKWHWDAKGDNPASTVLHGFFQLYGAKMREILGVDNLHGVKAWRPAPETAADRPSYLRDEYQRVLREEGCPRAASSHIYWTLFLAGAAAGRAQKSTAPLPDRIMKLPQ